MSSDVQFDEDNFSNAARAQLGRNSNSGSNQPAMVRWMMSHHLANSPAMANGILIAAIVANLAITIIVIKYLL